MWQPCASNEVIGVLGGGDWLLIGNYLLSCKPMNKMSVTEYAKYRGITRQAVLKQIKHNRILPGVVSYEKIGHTYFLTVNTAK